MTDGYKSINNHAMKVLENVRSGKGKDGMSKFDFERNVPTPIVNFLKGNDLILFEKGEEDFVGDIVVITEKGWGELKKVFKYK